MLDNWLSGDFVFHRQSLTFPLGRGKLRTRGCLPFLPVKTCRLVRKSPRLRTYGIFPRYPTMFLYISFSNLMKFKAVNFNARGVVRIGCKYKYPGKKLKISENILQRQLS